MADKQHQEESNMISSEKANELFEYRDGNLYWKTPTTKRNVGDLAGFVRSDGYKALFFNKKIYAYHRIIFLMHHGFLPQFIDHIDGNKLNNRIENLRQATKSQNCQNSKKPITNKSGSKNVYWHKLAKKWCVELLNNGKKKYIGLFEDLELADLVAHEARSKFNGNFANHGKQ